MESEPPRSRKGQSALARSTRRCRRSRSRSGARWLRSTSRARGCSVASRMSARSRRPLHVYRSSNPPAAATLGAGSSAVQQDTTICGARRRICGVHVYDALPHMHNRPATGDNSVDNPPTIRSSQTDHPQLPDRPSAAPRPTIRRFQTDPPQVLETRTGSPYENLRIVTPQPADRHTTTCGWSHQNLRMVTPEPADGHTRTCGWSGGEGAGVGGGVHLAELVDGDQGVDLRCRH
jgi:hypothetical protein